MSVTQLKETLTSNNVPFDGCIEKKDLTERLKKYIGLISQKNDELGIFFLFFKKN